MQTVAWIAGIPYPTGFPLYVIAGWIWTHALPFASVAARLNALSAVAVAGAAGIVCAIALMFDVAEAIAVAASWTFAFAFPIWLRGTYADVHPLGFAIALLAIAWAVRWVQSGDTRALRAAILLAAVAVGIDNTTVLILAGGCIVALGRRLPLRATGAGIAIAVIIVCAAYAWLPLRSAQISAARLDPTLALGIPAGRPFWDDHHPSTYEGFVSLVGGTAWSPGSSVAQLASWPVIAATAQRYGPHLAADFPYLLAYVAIVGGALVARTRPLVAIGLALAGVVPALFGASYSAEADPGRYAFALYAMCALGIAIAADRAARLARGRFTALAAGVVTLALLGVVANDATRSAPIVAARGDHRASDLLDVVTASSRDGAVVVTPWNYAAPLAYRAYVDGTFGRRVVLCGNVEDYSIQLYAGWVQQRQVVVVSDGPPDVAGFRTHLLAGGFPSVYELER